MFEVNILHLFLMSFLIADHQRKWPQALSSRRDDPIVVLQPAASFILREDLFFSAADINPEHLFNSLKTQNTYPEHLFSDCYVDITSIPVILDPWKFH